MNERVRDWAPLQAATSNRVLRKLDEAVAAWSERWFPAGPLEVRLTAVPAGRRDDDGPWQSHGAVVATCYPRSAAARVVERALGVRFEGLLLTTADRQVVSSLSQRIAQDLALTIESSLGIARDAAPLPAGAILDPWGPLGGVTAMICDPRGLQLCAALPLEVVAPICRAALPPRRTPSTPLVDRRKALSAKLVRVDARLGKAHLKLEELRALTPGDVIVLDSALEGGIELTLAGAQTALARAKLGERQGGLTLTLQTLS